MSSILTRPRQDDSPLVVIFNPRAARARGLGRRRLERALGERGLAFEIAEAASGEEARALAKSAAADGRIVVAAGGDGTAHEVGNGVLGSGDHDAIMGVLPLGTGNDFAKMLGRVGVGLASTLDALADPWLCRIDVGRVNGDEYFLNGLGVGFDAEVARRRSAARRPTRGYFPAVVRTILDYEPRSYRLSWSQGEVEGRALLLAVMNGTSEGGGFRLTPDARLDDGLLDVCRIDPVSLWKFARYAVAVRRGTHGRLPEVHQCRTDRVRVASASPLQYHLDGEYRELAAGEPLEVEVHRQRLQMIT